MAELPSGTVTFLFTDLEGSTRLWEDHPEAMTGALPRHDEILRDAIEGHRGHVVKARGDGFHAAFRTAQDALGAAVDAQGALAREVWGETGPLLVRMGIHTGETQERDGDYFGSAVNRAARVMAVAHGGQVLCSRATVDVAGGAFTVRSLGEHRLRDLGAPQELFQVGEGVFPPLRSVDVVPTNLPTVRTELIGRSDDVRALSELVARERLVTFTGVGGVGKTRLALGVAAAVADEYADGCWLVELAPVAAGDEVVTAVAGAMRAPTADLDALAGYLAERRMLIVLDNCEHVLDAAAELVDVVSAAAPDVHVVVTSREPLGLDGEQVRRVQSLAVPEPEAEADVARSAAAVRLFSQRAAAVADGFTIDTDNVAAVVEICRHLDGIPLAIELAAARVRAMPPAEIARRLDERFRLLAGGSRRAQERHRTLLATVSWSHDLLSEAEQLVFRRLAVFAASFDLAAAEAVAGDGEIDVVECLLRLVDRSLVDYEPDAGRYRLLETLRQYAADRLTDARETEKIREHHARWFLALAARVGPALDGAGFPSALAVLSVEVDNLRATADWCVESGRWVELAAMCHQLSIFLEQSAPVDGTVWFQQVVDHGSALDAQVVVDGLGVLAWLLVQGLGDSAGGTARAEESLTLAAARDVATSPWAWIAHAAASTFSGQFADELYATERALDEAEARNDERAAVYALGFQCIPLTVLGAAEHAAEVAADALRRAERTGNPLLIAAAVVSAAVRPSFAVAEPDFAASFDVLTRHAVGLRTGDQNDMWLDIAWGTTLLGLDRPGAVGHLARAVKTADRLNAPHVLDRVLRALAIAAADTGRIEHAAALAGYTETDLRTYRSAQPIDAWIQARLDRALAGLAEDVSHPPRHRREIMTIVNDLEASLAADLPA